jgi:hypothetical protein
MTALGAMRSTLAGLAEELDFDLEAFREAFREALANGMVKHDQKACLIALPNFIKYNSPESPNVVKAWANSLDLLPECSLKNEVISLSAKALKGYSKAFQEALPKAFVEALSKGMPNQEQEQEQEQEQKNNNNSASAIFEISLEWKPVEPSFSELLANMEIPLAKHTPKALKDYILNCKAKDPCKKNTQGQWELFFAKWLQREREQSPPPTPQQPKKPNERHVQGIPISEINAKARPGETEDDCAKRLKKQGSNSDKTPYVPPKLADDRPMVEILAEREALKKQKSTE